MSKRNKVDYVDDGHTVYDMKNVAPEKYKNKQDLYLTKKEKRAVIKAGFKTYLPMFICTILCFLLVMVLIGLWLG